MSPRKPWKSPMLRRFFSDLLAKKPPAKQAHIGAHTTEQLIGVHTTEQFMPWWNDEFHNLQYSFDIFPKWCVYVWGGLGLVVCGCVFVCMCVCMCMCVRERARARRRADV